MRKTKILRDSNVRVSRASIEALAVDGGDLVYLDPPYNEGKRGIYNTDENDVAYRAAYWAKESAEKYGDQLRVVYSGYTGGAGELLTDSGWERVFWKGRPGYTGIGSSGNKNRERECLWLSPSCVMLNEEEEK